MTDTPDTAVEVGGNRYRAVLSTPGALGFVIPGILARFPIGMTSISILLFVSAVRHEYATAGMLSATSAFGYALAAPQLAGVADRIGQRRVLLSCAVLCAASAAVFVTSVLHDAPLWTLFVSAAATGATTPAIGSLVRARWSGLLAGTPILPTAFALESVADELIFIFGPVIATFLATGVHPAAGVVCSVALVVGGSVALAAGRRTEPPRTAGPRARGSALFLGPVVVIAGVHVCFGAMWGAIDVGTVSLTAAVHHPAAAGLLLAGYGVGSTVAGFVYGLRDWRTPVPTVFHVSTGLMALGIAPMLLVGTLPAAAVVLVLAGAASCPALVAGMLLVQNGVPASHRTEALAWQSTAIWLGVAIGSSVSGHLADSFGAHAAYAVAVAGGCAGFAIATLGRRRVARSPAGAAG